MGGLRKLIGRLRQRRLGLVAAAYAVGAFAVMQVSDLLVDATLAPEPLVRWTVALGVAGFPLALAVAWLVPRGRGGAPGAAPALRGPPRRSIPTGCCPLCSCRSP